MSQDRSISKQLRLKQKAKEEQSKKTVQQQIDDLTNLIDQGRVLTLAQRRQLKALIKLRDEQVQVEKEKRAEKFEERFEEPEDDPALRPDPAIVEKEVEEEIQKRIDEFIFTEEEEIDQEEEKKKKKNLDDKIFSLFSEVWDDPIEFFISFAIENFPKFAQLGAFLLMAKKAFDRWWNKKEVNEQNRLVRQLNKAAPFLAPLLVPIVGALVAYFAITNLFGRASNWLNNTILDTNTWKNVKEVSSSVGEGLGLLLNTLALMLPRLVDGLGDIIDFTKDVVSGVGEFIEDPLGTVEAAPGVKKTVTTTQTPEARIKKAAQKFFKLDGKEFPDF